MWEAQVWSLGWEDTLEEGMATHSSILAWRIPWTEEPGGLQSVGSQRVDTPEWLTLSLSFLYHPEFTNGCGGAVLMCTASSSSRPVWWSLQWSLWGIFWLIMIHSGWLHPSEWVLPLSVNQLLNPQLYPGSECGLLLLLLSRFSRVQLCATP